MVDFEGNSNKLAGVFTERKQIMKILYIFIHLRRPLEKGSAAPEGGLSPGLTMCHLRAHLEAPGIQLGAEDVDPITLGVTQGQEPRVGI